MSMFAVFDPPFEQLIFESGSILQIVMGSTVSATYLVHAGLAARRDESCT
jgi:hypothetical protein